MMADKSSQPTAAVGLVGWCALLTAIVAVAWCSGTGKWSAASWGIPSQYLEGFYCDVVEGFAQAKAVTEGDYAPFSWKLIKRLGAPFDGNWTDRPSVEELNVFLLGIAAKCFGIFAGMNVSLLLGHVLAAVTFFLVAISDNCSRLWAFIGGLAFGLAPYIFAQSPHHITVAYAWHVPLFLLVWRWVALEPSIEWGSRRFWAAIGIAFLAGLQNPYYTNILCQLTLLGSATLAWRRGSWAPLKPALAIIGAAAAAFVLMNIDTWTYKLVHGPNTGALVREYKWMEIYGLKLVDLVIPPATHHSDGFAAFAIKHKIGDPARGIPPASPLQDEGSYLGIVGLLALGWLAWTSVSHAVKGRANDIPLAAWQVLWIVLCFTTGGLNAILGAFGFTLFRTGQRYSIVILAIALLYAAQNLTAWQRRASASTPAEQLRIMVLTAAAALGFLILWDQVPRAPSREQTAAIARQVEADREFTGKMEEALPAGAMVFQMPVMEFPESPLPGVPPYDHFRPYLYSKNLRFSYGSMKGREREKWQPAVQAKLFEGASLDQQAGKIKVNEANARIAVDELKRLGFSAIYINRNGFPDRGKGLEEALLDLGYTKPPIRNATGDLACIVLEK
jgi:hypothetical protein